MRQLDRVSRELLSRAWAAGAGPGDGPLTIDLDSTICETYGLAKEGVYVNSDALNVRGAAHFLRETVGRGCLRGSADPTRLPPRTVG